MQGIRQRWRERPFDVVLMACLLGFVTGWLTFDLPTTLGIETAGMAWYGREIDPFTLAMPLHIELTVAAAALLYGPLYLVLVWGLWRNARWTWKVALPLAGMVVASTVIHMAAALTSETPPVNLPAFLALNSPYVLAGLLLIVRFTRDPPPASAAGH